MRLFRGSVVVLSILAMSVSAAAAHGHGPGTVFTCQGGKVTKATPILVTNGAPRGSAFVQTLEPGAGPEQVCEAINASANILGNFKTETEGNNVVVVYGADVRLNKVPDGIKLKIDKF